MGSAASNTDLGRMPTVLIVDDEPVICTLASDYLRDAGYRTLEAHSAQQAIDLLEKGEHVDLVFSDIQMPGIDGFELQRWLRWNQPRVKVLLSSGVENVKAAGGYMGPPRWLVFKPYDMADLEQRIRDMIRGWVLQLPPPDTLENRESGRANANRLLDWHQVYDEMLATVRCTVVRSPSVRSTGDFTVSFTPLRRFTFRFRRRRHATVIAVA